MDIWSFIDSQLSQNARVVLLYVVDSQGSSPGRQGFRMAIGADGAMEGTIGGGIMEHKWVERAREMRKQGDQDVLLVRQYHDKTHGQNQSGMICSGEQMLAIVPLSAAAHATIQAILADPTGDWLQLLPSGLSLVPPPGTGPKRQFRFTHPQDWCYAEALDQRPRIHLIGGGHVSLALSEVMHRLGFYVRVYDERPGLHTLENNPFAHEKHTVSYATIGADLQAGPQDFVVIMTFGYRPDKVVFRQLIKRNFFYLGMLGSDAKVQQLFAELEEAGMDPASWRHVHAPVGLPIYSRTAGEIAISISAEIIREKNRHLPSGRSGTEK